MLCRFYTPNKGGIEEVAEQHSLFYNKMGYKVNIICMDSSLKTGMCKRKGKFNENIYSFKPFLNLQSVLISFKYIFFSIYKLLKCNKNVIFHIHYPSPLDALIISFVKLFKKNTLIIIYHANILNKNYFLKKISNIFSKISFYYADKVIFTSKKLQENNKNSFKIENKSEHLYIANPFFTTEINKYKKINKILKIIFIGRLVPYKGVNYLIDAVSGLKEFELNIIGHGPLKKELYEKISRNGLSNSIFIHDDLSDKNKHYLLSQSDCLILPSINEAEAFGIVQLEALSYGLPVINTQLPSGVPEISKHLKSGITVPPRNSIAIKEAIELLATDKELYEQLSKGALERSKDFNIENIFTSFQNIIKQFEQNNAT